MLDLVTYIYILYQENHSERCQLPTDLVLPRYSGYILRRSLPGLRRSRWIHCLIHRCLLLVDQNSTRVSGISSRWHLRGRAIFSESVHQIISIIPALCGESKYQSSLQWESIWRGTGTVFSCGWWTGVTFSLPQWTPNSYTSLSFCTWNVIADTVPGYGINTSCIKAIKSTYSAYKGSKTTHKKGMNEFLDVELEAGWKEAADVSRQRE